MNTFRFVARRRGQSVIIKGKVMTSAVIQEPYLERIEGPASETMTYRLEYRRTIKSFNYGPETPALVVYEEREMPAPVRRIRIVLPGDREFIIESQVGRDTSGKNSPM
jgi:hypothetical protein